MNFVSGHRSHRVTPLPDSEPAVEVVGVLGPEVVDRRSIDVAGEVFGWKNSSVGDVNDEEVGRLMSLGAVWKPPAGFVEDENIMGLL